MAALNGLNGIVALRGTDCGCGMGVDAAANPAPVSTSTKVFWALALGTVGFIFWATLQPAKRKLVS